MRSHIRETFTDAAGTVQTSKALVFYERDGSTPLAIPIYKTSTGTSTYSSPDLVTNGDGEFEGWTNVPRRVQISVSGRSSKVISRFIPDETDDVLRVTDCGAKGDGVTDDSAAIQFAFDHVADGGRVVFPKGRYKVVTPLTIFRHHSIILEGASSGIISLSGSSYSFLGGGSVLLNYTGGTMLTIQQQYGDGLVHNSNTRIRNLAFESQDSTVDVNVYAYVGPSYEPSGRLFFEHCIFVRGFQSFKNTDFFDYAFRDCYFVGYPATGTGWTGAGKTAVYLEGAADMGKWDNCFFANWDTNVKANPVNAGSLPSHPSRLEFTSTKLESTRLTNLDIQNVYETTLFRCHIEASGQADPSLYYDIHYGNIDNSVDPTSDDAVGILTMICCDFAPTVVETSIKAGPKFGQMLLIGCWTTNANATAFAKLDNSGVLSYGSRIQSSVLVLGGAIHGKFDTTNYLGAFQRIGAVNPSGGHSLVIPSDVNPLIMAARPVGTDQTVDATYHDQIDLAAVSAASVLNLTAGTLNGQGPAYRRLMIHFSNGNVTLKGGGTGTAAMVLIGGGNHTYGSDVFAEFLHTGVCWFEKWRSA